VPGTCIKRQTERTGTAKGEGEDEGESYIQESGKKKKMREGKEVGW